MTPGGRHAGALVSVSLHALAATALLAHEPARTAVLAAAPLMFELIAPPSPTARAELPAVAPAPVRPPAPLPRPRPAEPLRVVAPPAETPAPVVVAPSPAPDASPTPISVAAAAPQQLPLTLPVFNADYLNNPPPEYPPLSARLGEEGIVLLQVLVSIAGAPEDVRVLKTSGYTRLDRAALDAVKRWKFIPARRGSETVAALAQVPIRFSQKD